MQQPNRPRYRKAFKGRIRRGYFRGGLEFGDVGLRAVEGGRVSARQLEAARRSLRRGLSREGVVWSRQFPYLPVTGKPSEVRRGKGKGGVSYWCARVRPGHPIFEVGGNVSTEVAVTALKQAAHKLSVRTVISYRLQPLAATKSV